MVEAPLAWLHNQLHVVKAPDGGSTIYIYIYMHALIWPGLGVSLNESESLVADLSCKSSRFPSPPPSQKMEPHYDLICLDVRDPW